MPKRSLRKFLPTPARLRDVRGWVCFEICSIDTNFGISVELYRTCYGDWPFCSMVPLPGQMIVAVFVAIRVGANVPGIFLIFITNPLTMPVIYLAAYLLGSACLMHLSLMPAPLTGLIPRAQSYLVSGPPSSWAVLLWVSSLPFSAISLPTVYGDAYCAANFGESTPAS